MSGYTPNIHLVWTAIKRFPGVQIPGIAELVCLTHEQVRMSLLRLEEKGMLEKRAGHANKRRVWKYYAVKGKRRPHENLSGRHKNSRANLELAPGFQPQCAWEYKSETLKRGKPPPVPKPSTELERCWGFNSIVDTKVSTRYRNCSPRTPEENVSEPTI